MTLDNNHTTRHEAPILLASLLIISSCAIFYELLISSISTYLLGSSILHFSITIGIFLSSMGLGAYLSKYVERNLLSRFILIEFVLGALGGMSALILYCGFAFTNHYYLYLIPLIGLLGTLIGMEIPLLTRLLKQYDDIKDVIAKVLAFDYLGALVASILFPLLLLPMFGMMRTAFLVGLINISVAIFNLIVFRSRLKNTGLFKTLSIAIPAVLISGFVYSYQLVSFFDQFQYSDKVIYSEQTPYQNIVLTRWNNDIRLFLNGNLQFSSIDEYRYHEALVHIPALLSNNRSQVLVLGGGDGLVAKELLKYDDVQSIDLIDIDSRITELARQNPLFLELNDSAFHNKKVNIYNDDAFSFVHTTSNRYNLIIIDLPDPSDHSVSKLYSREFYDMLTQILAADGIMVSQSTSPFYTRKPFWCIHHTMEAAFPRVIAYQTYVPSFGLWGFNMAVNKPLCDTTINTQCETERIANQLTLQKLQLKYLSLDNLQNCFQFDGDTEELDTDINTLNDHHLVDMYEHSWGQFSY